LRRNTDKILVVVVGPIRDRAAKIGNAWRRLTASPGCRSLARKIIYSLAFAHLFVVALVVCHGTDPWVSRGWWQRPLVFWGGINYSLWCFGFFSPDVGKSSEIEFKITQENGQVRTFSTLTGFDFFTSNRESLARFYCFKVQGGRDPALQDLCARSAIVRLINELGMSAQQVSTVDYAIRSIRYPTMDGYRNSKPAETVEFYNTRFVVDPQ
jgi:hypothetical protein